MAKFISFDQAGDAPQTSGKVINLETFWRLVARNESHVRDHRGPSPPPDRDAEPDGEFEDAYEAIKFYLRPLRSPRMFLPPPEAPGLVPYPAETAHQALMFFLNPPDPLLGHPRLLDSPEYLQIKREALAELAAIQGKPTNPKAAEPASSDQYTHGPATVGSVQRTTEAFDPDSNSRGRKTSPRARGTEVTPEFLERWLLRYHRRHQRAGWLSQEEIAKKLKCSQSTISRAMPRTFGGGGTRVYKVMFKRDEGAR